MSNPQLCPLCQSPNNCELINAAGSAGRCWCMQVKIAPEILAQIPADQINVACICKNCAYAVKPEPL
ncbi:MAG: cysteine-rich CWC family protein [Cellvibrio sp.]